MEPRLNLQQSALAAKAMKFVNSASMVVLKDPALPKATQDLVMLRASQINGCGYCTDIHTKDAAYAGETPVRINLVAAWRESRDESDPRRDR